MVNNDAITYIAGYYGEENQLIQTAEEAAELAQAALKRHKALTTDETMVATQNALAEEIADVLIMCEQIIYLEGFETRVRRIIVEKLNRQISRIKGGTNK